MEVLEKMFAPTNPPALSYQPAACPDAKATPPASYCPGTNTIVVDLPGLAAIGGVADGKRNRPCRRATTPRCRS